MRSLSDSLHGRMNPHLSAAMKLTTSSLRQEFSETAMEVLGALRHPHGRSVLAVERALGEAVSRRPLDDDCRGDERGAAEHRRAAHPGAPSRPRGEALTTAPVQAVARARARR